MPSNAVFEKNKSVVVKVEEGFSHSLESQDVLLSKAEFLIAVFQLKSHNEIDI